MPHCSFTGAACLPGLNLLPDLQRQLCRQSGAVPTFCHSCPGVPVDKTAAHCALWGAGRMQWDVAELSAPGPGSDALCNRSSLAFVAPRTNGACARSVPLRSEALRLLGGQTIAFVGDSLMRQVFTRTVAWMRGQSTLADPAFHSDGASGARLVAHTLPPTHTPLICAAAALYLADGEQDALVPVFPAYGAACALELADGKTQSPRCQKGLEQELYGKSLRNDMARARQDLWRYAEPVLGSSRWRQKKGRLTLVFLWRPQYDAKFMGLQGLEVLEPHVVVAGAIGTHTPCWSDGKAGGKCPIETVTEKAHRLFWLEMRESVARSTNLRLLTWLSLPYGHTAARYSNGNYSAYNGRAKRELMAIGRQAAHVHVRVVDFAALIKRPGLFRAGVLARRDDNTHFQCIARGSFFYPSPKVIEAKTLKVLMEAPGGHPSPISGAVSCPRGPNSKGLCAPNVDDGCADPVNLALVRTLLRLIATRERRDQQVARGCCIGCILYSNVDSYAVYNLCNTPLQVAKRRQRRSDPRVPSTPRPATV